MDRLDIASIKRRQIECAKNIPDNFCTAECFHLTPREKVHLNFALKAEMGRLGLPMLPKRHTNADRFVANQYPMQLRNFATEWYETPENRCYSKKQEKFRILELDPLSGDEMRELTDVLIGELQACGFVGWPLGEERGVEKWWAYEYPCAIKPVAVAWIKARRLISKRER